MTGVQLMTGTPTYRSRSPVAPYLVDIDIETHRIDDPPEIIDWILRLMKLKDWVLIGLSWVSYQRGNASHKSANTSVRLKATYGTTLRAR